MASKNAAAQIKKIIANALREDIGTGDITTRATVPPQAKGVAQALAKDDFIAAGMGVFKKTFLILDKRIKVKSFVADGETVKKGDIIARVEGPLASILQAERVALNILQRMCGIATQTNKFVKTIAGTKAKILDTRKTVPGLRLLDKMAVKAGGGCNHRMGLYDAVLIKDNHITAAGGITQALTRQKKALRKKTAIEVETKNLGEVAQAMDGGADIIMLDNMPLEEMEKALKIIGGKALVEASGNVSLDNVADIARIGVDFISVGEITHSVRAADISLKINNKK